MSAIDEAILQRVETCHGVNINAGGISMSAQRLSATICAAGNAPNTSLDAGFSGGISEHIMETPRYRPVYAHLVVFRAPRCFDR